MHMIMYFHHSTDDVPVSPRANNASTATSRWREAHINKRKNAVYLQRIIGGEVDWLLLGKLHSNCPKHMPQAQAQTIRAPDSLNSTHLCLVLVREKEQRIKATVLRRLEIGYQCHGLSERRRSIKCCVQKIRDRVPNTIDIGNNAIQLGAHTVCFPCRVYTVLFNMARLDQQVKEGGDKPKSCVGRWFSSPKYLSFISIV